MHSVKEHPWKWIAKGQLTFWCLRRAWESQSTVHRLFLVRVLAFLSRLIKLVKENHSSSKTTNI